MSDRGGFSPQDTEAFANYREMIRVTSNEADKSTERAGLNFGLGVGAGVGSVILGLEVSPIVGAIGAAPTGFLVQNGVRHAIEAIRSGSKSATLQALHNYEMYEGLLAAEQAQIEGPDQPQ